MRTMRKLIATGLAIVMSLSVVACSGKKTSNKTSNGGKEVEVAYWHAGLGIDWLEELVNEFNASQSEWNVTYRASAVKGSLTAAWGMPDIDTTDLYIAGMSYESEYMEPLDELLNVTAEGDSKTIGEKLNPNYLTTARWTDGKIYTLSATSSLYGIVYNTKLFKKAGITQLPRTSDEIAVVCDMLLEADVTPLAVFGNWAYWDFFIEAWQAQHDGYDYYINNFHGCTDEKGNSPSKDVLTKKDGRYAALQAMEKIITPEYVVDGAVAEDHISMQTKFLNTDIGMMVNGNWLSKEMSGVASTDDFGLMKTPVISSIVDRLTTIVDDEELRLLIDAVDEVVEDPSKIANYQSGDGYVVGSLDVSKEDWDAVMEARTISPVGFDTAYIPNYSEEKEGAKEFLKFMYSDKGMEIVLSRTHISMPLEFSDGREIDKSDWNRLERESDEALCATKYYATSALLDRHPIFRLGGASSYCGSTVVATLCSKNPADRLSADGIWDEIVRLIDMKYEGWLLNIE